MKQFIITEQEKYNILKQYGLFEQEELQYPIYANKTMPYPKLSDNYNPTWKYVQSPITTISLININFPYNKTKSIKINNQYDLNNTQFKNVDNIVRISTPKNFQITTIQLTDNDDRKYVVNEKNNNDDVKMYPYPRPGDKYYTPPSGPFATPLRDREFYNLTGMEWDDVVKAVYEPNIDIPVLGKMSFMDIVVSILNIIPYGQIFSVLAELSSGYYFLQKGDKYEAGLRFMFLLIPFGEIPKIRELGKKGFIVLLDKLRDLSKNPSAINKLTKKDFNQIIELFKQFIKNGKTLKEKIQRGLKLIKLFLIWVKAISALKLEDFLFRLYLYNKSNPTSFAASSKKLLFTITNLLAKSGIIMKTWDEIWETFASEKDKFQRNLNQTLEEYKNKPMSSLDLDDNYSIFNALSTNSSLLNYVSSQS